jgi:2-amino-4-hydroxy-6-hydroxymethyldihydropteridine diphosphokinase
VGVGSNRGERSAHLWLARRNLSELLDGLVCSDVYETAPVGDAGDRPFLNMCCTGATTLGPEELLAGLQAVEEEAGRPAPGTAGRSGARTLDLDLLLYGDRTVEEPGLVVPHRRLAERSFVLVPLSEVAGDWKVPGHEARVAELAERLEHDGMERVGPLEALTRGERERD